MTDEWRDIKQRISQLSDEQLIEMLTVSAADYRKEALDYAKAEFNRRRLELPSETPEVPESEPTDAAIPLEPAATDLTTKCPICGGRLRAGTLVAEKELTIVFSDNQEERFIRSLACVRCGQVYL